jgi:DMSO/TMAO reductase YedYZ molybdopterin-dependent catalytic subunit
MATRGFFGRRPDAATRARLPPGQHLTEDFPVLSFGPTPTVDRATWRFTLSLGPKPLARWTWDEFEALPQTTWRGDIHCVTTWSKFDTVWQGVSVDELFARAGLTAPSTPYLLARSHDGYDTNVLTEDLVGGKALVATRFGGAMLEPEHGGPARLLVPHLYFWKSAKWLEGLRFTQRDEAGFWELRGYHMRGDPWQQQRYSDDP